MNKTEKQDLNIKENHFSRRFYISAAIMFVFAAVGALSLTSAYDINPLLFLAIYSVPSNMAISVFPHEPLVVYMGQQHNIWLISALTMIGTWVAGLLDYFVFGPIFAHRITRILRGTKTYKDTIRLFNYSPFLALVIGGFTPLPFFVFKFLSIASKYPLGKYLTALLIGRFPRYLLLAWSGQVMKIPPIYILLVFILMVIFYGIKGFRQIRSARKIDEIALGELPESES